MHENKMADRRPLKCILPGKALGFVVVGVAGLIPRREFIFLWQMILVIEPNGYLSLNTD